MDKYQYFLFDWDGCLAKTLEVWLDAYKERIAAHGAHPTDEEIAYHFGDWELPKYFGIKDHEACNTEAVAIAREELKQVSLYEGAKDLLKSLHGDKKLALLSSASKDILLKGVTHNKVQNYFDVILSGEDVEHHKPHPEVIEKGLAALHGDKATAVMIGDSRKDIEAARNAGIDSILIYPQSHATFYDFDELKTLQPTHIFSSLTELQQALDATA